MDDFDENPPFTIQRICELASRPRTHYKTVGKYLRAIERTLLVTSTWDQYTLDTYALDNPLTNPGAVTSSDALRHATTPLFSPIPFLTKGEAPPSPLSLDTVRPAIVDEPRDTMPEDLHPPPLKLGLVDEMDDLTEGANHMAEYPKAISSTTTLPDVAPGGALGLSLTERFTRSTTPEPSPARVAEIVEKEEGTAEGVKVEDNDVDNMVLDEPNGTDESDGKAGES